MAQDLENLIKDQIRLNGPLSVEAYWNLCLAHPQYGYYITRDPLGVAGDFTTAPEISQLFGEMIGIWVAEQWQRLGSPVLFHLAELGPGRGTLMEDLLRIGKMVPGFMDAVHIHCVETSPRLREKQRAMLSKYQVAWHDHLGTVPDVGPLMIIGNEFLDALPIQQYVCQNGQSFERLIGISGDGNLTFGLSPVVAPISPQGEQKDGVLFEMSVAREQFINMSCDRIKRQRGTILMIDYGHDVSGFGDTFQALKNHQFSDVLSDCGDVDLTSHVDFGRLKHIAIESGLSVRLQGQGRFLKLMGIEARAAQLMVKSDTIATGLHRLVDPTEMGDLFRVMEVI
jgi:NADH dehydrogenase [ubiquinone] 1 alpha subcomplex assembly factor 7